MSTESSSPSTPHRNAAVNEADERPDESGEAGKAEPVVEIPAHDQEVARLRDERDLLEQQLQRSLADTANMRRRQKQEADDNRRRVVEELTLDLLPVLDTFTMALAAGEQENTDPKALLEGVRLVRTMLWNVLAQRGLAEIAAEGQQFDPLYHDAVAVEPSPGVPEGRIVRVLQTGYTLGDRVVRHSRVVVAGPAANASPKED